MAAANNVPNITRFEKEFMGANGVAPVVEDERRKKIKADYLKLKAEPVTERDADIVKKYLRSLEALKRAYADYKAHPNDANVAKSLETQCERFNKWCDSLSDIDESAPTNKELVENILARLQSRHIEIMDKGGRRTAGISVFPKMSKTERELRIKHYVEYNKLRADYLAAKKLREAQLTANPPVTPTITKEDLKKKLKALRDYGKSRTSVCKPARTVYGELLDTENLFRDSLIGDICRQDEQEIENTKKGFRRFTRERRQRRGLELNIPAMRFIGEMMEKTDGLRSEMANELGI